MSDSSLATRHSACPEPVEGPLATVAVVLFQLGGPDSLEAVEPFLFNLFSDPDIIDFPFARLARPTLAHLIASRRAEHVRRHYAEIGGKSPIRDLTERQRAALETELRRSIDARVFVAMRYWHPLTQEALAALESHACSELVLLPLYPQYSTTTTGSSLNEWRRLTQSLNGRLPQAKLIREFYQDSLYLDALAGRINEGLGKFNEPEKVTLVFSAHSVPVKVIEAGDPYQSQIEATVRLVMERGGWTNPKRLCYQSRVGPGRWLQPTLDQTLHDLAAQHVRDVLVVPPAFVTDHVETLHEIDIDARHHASQLGFRQFEVMPALNDSPTFIRALARLVLERLAQCEPRL
jgi:protoporphyrin/coproporphyrin ferrochelatase